jgi:hypothetical protein
MELNMRYVTTADRVRIVYPVAGRGMPDGVQSVGLRG